MGSIMYEFQDRSIKLDATEALIIEPNKIHRNTISQSTFYKAIFLPIAYFEHEGQNKLLTQKIIQPDVVNKIVDLFNKIELNSSKIVLKEIALNLGELIVQPKIEMAEILHSGINNHAQNRYPTPLFFSLKTFFFFPPFPNLISYPPSPPFPPSPFYSIPIKQNIFCNLFYVLII